MPPFEFYRPPLEHQRGAFERFKNEHIHALFWEQRTRKTSVELSIFRYLYGIGAVDALISIAFPNGVHRVWMDELALDYPPEFMKTLAAMPWESGKMTTGERRERVLSLRDHDGPVVLGMNCEALITPAGWKYLQWFLYKRKVMLVADEASWAANWSARTRKLLSLGGHKNVLVKSILDGTPVDEGPEDIFFPTQFLRKGLLGFNSKLAFRSRYLAYRQDEHGNRVKGVNRKTGSEYDIIVGTQNLEELHGKLMTFGSRVLRKDVSDAPEKTYQPRYFDMTDKQRKVYEKARDEYVAEMEDGSFPLTDVLLRVTRLQMIARNYYPAEKQGAACPVCNTAGFVDDEECRRCEGLGYVVEWTKLQRIDKVNPAAEALIQEAQATRGPLVVWCCFRQDVQDAMEALKSIGREPLQYDGSIPNAQREANYQAFRAGKGTDIVGTILSGLSRGKDLTRATALVYYSNVYSLRARRQSEDRAEGLLRTISTDVVDLIASDTRDLHNIQALREKRSRSEIIMGDAPVRWL